MWTLEKVKDFLNKYPIDTRGAISKWSPKITEKDDGDTWVEVICPYWPQNDSVTLGVLKLAVATLEAGNTAVYPDSPKLQGFNIKLQFFKSICDPD